MGLQEKQASPVDLGSLDLRGVHARIEYPEGEPTMVVCDGDSEIEFSSGMGGSWRDAVHGAQELAAVALAFADELRRRGRPVPG